MDPNHAIWVDEARAAAPASTPAAALDREIRTDVAILGGGLTGVSTAWHLRQRHPELGIVLLEAGVLGQGASGRNGGQVLNWVNGVQPRTPEEALRIHAATRAGIDLAEELARRYAPPGTFSRNGCLEVYTDLRRSDAAAARAEKLRVLGIPSEFLAATRLRIAGATGAVLDPLAGRLNAYALLNAMRPVLQAAGVELFEHSRARVVELGSQIVLEAARGRVRARTLVLATNAYTPALGFFRRQLLPLHSHVIATEPLAPDRWSAAGWGAWDAFSDDLDRIAFACRTPQGRLLFGGGGNPAYAVAFGGGAVAAEDAAGRAAPFLHATLARYFPAFADARVERAWSGPIALTLDRVCSMGVSGAAGNVYHALGYSGHGLALALLAGRVLADLYDDHPEPWRALPFYQRRMLPMPPEPLRWLGYQVYTRLTGRSPRRQAELESQ
jgi:glycine/D-amino acid oxidase-like deaminating enzyme